MRSDLEQEMLDISVVFPYHNEAKSLLITLDLISQQTQMPSEVFLVNSSSTDNSSELVDSWIAQSQHAYTTKFYNVFEGTDTPSSSKNVGIRKSRSSWIAFMDCGLLFERDWLEKQWNFLQLNPDCEVVSGVCFLKGEGVIDSSAIAQTYGYDVKRSTVPSSVVKRSIFDQHGLFLENRRAGYDAEWQLMLRRKNIKRGINNDVVIRYMGINFGKTLRGIYRKSIMYATPTVAMPYYNVPYWYLTIMLILLATIIWKPLLVPLWILAYIALRGFYIPYKKSSGLKILRDYPSAIIMLPVLGFVIDTGRMVGIFKGFAKYHLGTSK